MTKLVKNNRFTLLAALTACAFALAAADAYAKDMMMDQTISADSRANSRVWIEPKTAISKSPAVIRAEDRLPQIIIPMNRDIKIDIETRDEFTQTVSDKDKIDLRNFDLVDDNPIFIGATKDPEFDTLESRRQQAAYSKALNVDPLIPIAGAGLKTDF